MPPEGISEISVVVDEKEYSLNYHKMEIQFEEIPSFILNPITFTGSWKITRKQRAMLNKLERKLKKDLKKILMIRRFKFAK